MPHWKAVGHAYLQSLDFAAWAIELLLGSLSSKYSS